MVVESVSSSSSVRGQAASTSKLETNKEDFLSLLLTQLQYQDPFKAADADKFTEQMTQFGQLEQLFNLNDGMDRLADRPDSSEKYQAVNYIDKVISVASDQIQVANEGGSKYAMDVNDSGSRVTVQILDSNGQVLRNIEHDNLDAGRHIFEFDGLDGTGNRLNPGEYKIAIFSQQRSGQVKDVQPITFTKVTGVEYHGDDVLLKAGEKKYPLNRVLSVEL